MSKPTDKKETTEDTNPQKKEWEAPTIEKFEVADVTQGKLADNTDEIGDTIGAS
ncbi:hypothetical protein MLD52_14300 [Puniceicoccaceae bacterium K14]|nr:hypothetical protein [Puniceicoccaceae bacterium K14]